MPISREELISAALDWAAAGIPVFPVRMPSKAPATKNGFLDAVTDEAAVVALFSAATGTIGIGGAMGNGLFAVDIDLYKPGAAGDSAKAFYKEETANGNLPSTRTHHTLSGGVHMLYSTSGAAPSCKPAAGVEVKGDGGYIVLPPTDGYTVEKEGVATAPASLMARLAKNRLEQRATTIEALTDALVLATDFHDTLTQLAAKLAADGKGTAQAVAYIRDALSKSLAAHGDHERHSRWSALMSDKGGELSRIVTSAQDKYNPEKIESALSELGEGIGAAALEAFGSRLKKVPTSSGLQEASKSTALTTASDNFPIQGGYFGYETLDVLDQEYIAYPILAEGETMVISAKPKAGKTLLAQTLGMHIAAGASLGDIKIEESRPVIYFSLEGQVTVRRRLMAWKRSVDPNGTQLTEETFPFFVSERPINLLKEENRTDFANAVAMADAYWRNKGFAGLGAFIVDTLTKAMPGGNQNDVEDTSAVFDVISMVRALGCSAPAIFIHHDSKTGDVRGSSNIQAEPDTLLGVEQVDSRIDLVVRMARNIEGSDRWSFEPVSVSLGKTPQGYDIAAPIAIPITKDSMSGELSDAADFAAAEMLKEKDICETIIKLGMGKHTIAKVHNALVAALSPTVYTVAVYPSSSEAVYEYMSEVIPQTGITYGDYHIMPTLKEQLTHTGRRKRIQLLGYVVKQMVAAAI